MRKILQYVFLIFFISMASSGPGFSQKFYEKRSSVYAVAGTSGARLNQFDQILTERGITGLPNRYQTVGLGVQSRLNDLVVGFEIYQNSGGNGKLDDYRIDYRTSRALVNIGYSFTEESRFQLIHYMSLGVGFLNFQMLPLEEPSQIDQFLEDPARGFVLRENDIQKGTSKYGNFLTEIGFHLSYDFALPGREEAISLIGKFGYSFSPFQGEWTMNGVSFENTQEGAFLRVGAGITIPDRNFFYKDASISFSLLNGFHFSKPDQLNSRLSEAGLNPFEGTPSNLGLKILGQNEKLLYGLEIYNLALDGRASDFQSHSLNSLRLYGDFGWKIFQVDNFATGVLGGLGYGNIRYTITQDNKPDFPQLFEERDFDGYLRNGGLMGKPEVFFEYGLPIQDGRLFDLVFSTSFGYEFPLSNYRLADLSMAKYMAAPYWNLAIGIRP
ncbi:hypothetical protein [Algoriphagus sediminis]|uniref:Bacterial surface antigen (D15) domain-containing protein n=1 Tax=Algoriphagus sediminis TaxID=3057113 RepID=A0ABT7YAA9_9BACT|nr:hypothetical protein [Algoriphagus sediminis]MDN3203428.1 hypothetical protein [Algoriphagus sediminis]